MTRTERLDIAAAVVAGVGMLVCAYIAHIQGESWLLAFTAFMAGWNLAVAAQGWAAKEDTETRP